MKLVRAMRVVPALVMVWTALPCSAQTPTTPSISSPQIGRPADTQPAAPAASAPSQPTPSATPDHGQPTIAVEDAGRPLGVSGHMQRDLSPWSMFLAADILVKGVLISLAFASLVTWTIFLAKSVQIAGARRRLRSALAQIADTRTLSEAQLTLHSGDTALSALLRAAFQEMRLSGHGAGSDGIKDRAASRFSEIARAEARNIRQGMAIIATIGATSPFVGLFGTVWGIMNSFVGISKAQTTNLAVVAPGIAEALLATAIGLAAAIPAVIIYNHFSRLTKGYLEFVGRGSGAVGRLLSRDLERARGLSRAAE